ncbi:MAG: 1-(5-phosphoribosyl)-5-[(5-phosphoribosylamino)methylideneamino]imidazole-4-carboxamide isomerase [Peptococcaceae bacterium]|jgi:phosphoribosylformimino-5-aminoimidazole carboxamide ribotide isomerase|nr:1-(5-phosphoribosyl)-5-[(5-phosphoribosylamino)methylideneamino]imidazole-4-carboxamide isomerase [Peptococcaceae bacterium]
MLIIPAVDIRGGRCVRLVEGRLDRETVYGEDPPAMAVNWQEQGAKRLHVVDLDGAFKGSPVNLETIARIARAVGIPVQAGGGIRTLDMVDRLFELGVDRVVLGTAAVRHPELLAGCCRRYGERIIAGLDAAGGQVAIEGWVTGSGRPVLELAREMKELGVVRVLYTDVRRDGTLRGPNVRDTGELARASGLKVIASGGVSSLADLAALQELEGDGVEAVIVGKALYAGNFTLREALAEMAPKGAPGTR